MSDLSDSLTVALLTWATWAIRSQLLFCPEWSELIAHSRSLNLSDLSEWKSEQIPSPARGGVGDNFETKFEEESTVQCYTGWCIISKTDTMRFFEWPWSHYLTCSAKLRITLSYTECVLFFLWTVRQKNNIILYALCSMLISNISVENLLENSIA